MRTRHVALVPAVAVAALMIGAPPSQGAPAPTKWYTVCDLNKPNPYPFDFVLTHAKHANSPSKNIRIAITSAKSMYGTWLMEDGGGGAMLAENGKFDSRTVKAMKRFQRAKGIKPSGKIGSLTWAALGEYCSMLQ